MVRPMSVQEKIKGAIGVVIVAIVLLACTPIVVDQVQGLNTSGWDFTGSEGAIALVGLVPFIWVAGILIATVVMIFMMAKGGD
jgi:hypothetical protein